MREQAGVRDQTLTFLKLVAHDLRWCLLQELSRSDLRVNELVARLGEPGNLVSYHLALLRADGLVRERHSSADGRVVYYSLDLERFQRQMVEAAERIRPGLVTSAPPSRPQRGRRSRQRVLFLCTHNSARSQMAEGLLRAAAGDRLTVTSAGTAPTRLHPLATEEMTRRGVDISGQRPKHADALTGRRFDIVITLCDHIREICPTFAGSPDLVHWSLPDPARDAAPAAMRATFEQVADQIAQRVRYLVVMLDERMARS
jgi:protein-tyrosine-phosphatase